MTPYRVGFTISSVEEDKLAEEWQWNNTKRDTLTRLSSYIEILLNTNWLFPKKVHITLLANNHGVLVYLSCEIYTRHVWAHIEELSGKFKPELNLETRLRQQIEQLYRLCTNFAGADKDQQIVEFEL